MKTWQLFSVLALFGGTLVAQNPTPKASIPDGLMKKEGSSYHWPVWYYNNARVQYLFSSKLIGATAPKVLQGFYIRPNGSSGTGLAKKVDIEVQMSSKGVKVNNPNLKAWTNHGTDLQTVIKKRTFNYPSYNKPSTPPHKWLLNFKFDKPFVRTGADLAVDFKGFVPTTQTSYWYADCEYFGTDRGTVRNYGTGCPSSYTQYGGYFYVGASSAAYSYGYSRASGDVIVAWVGATKLGVKIPGTSCTLYAPFNLLHPIPVKTTRSNGYARFTWGKIPAALAGKTAYFQMGGLNHGVLKLSRGMEVKVGTGKSGGGMAIYGYAFGTRSYDPNKDAPQFNYQVVPVLGVY
jgi:hypothetical protein